MSRWIKITGAVVLGLVLGMAACVPLASVSRPKPVPGEAAADHADSLARAMELAINKAGWDSTAFVRWNFIGVHGHLWDKQSNRVRVRWSSYTVYLDASTLNGRAWKKDEELEGEALRETLAKATDYFFNDSFWLNAPAKAFDDGVQRELARTKKGDDRLLLTYTDGGITPGDTYAWTLDTNGLPLAWNMWVQVLPIQGLGNTWEDWQTLYSGARIATRRAKGPFGLRMIRDLEAAPSLEQLGEPADALADWRFGRGE